MRKFLSFILLLGLSSSMVSAQVTSDGFGIRVGGNDTEPPSTPTLLSVTPIAPTQLDVTWSAATDDVAVSGYSLWRNGVPIATTSLLSYSDTGLAPSTTYAYVVRAFDPSLNYSSTSNSIATTTPAVPLPPPTATTTTSSGGASIARVVLENFTVVPDFFHTIFTLETAHPARSELRWGKTGSYELGYVMSDIYTTTHTLQLSDLESQTTYEYELIGYTPAGYQTILKRGRFTTLTPAVPTPPQNVGYFIASGEGNDVALSWQLPLTEAVLQVRVVRSHFGFPDGPYDGAVVYQGSGESARDVGILAQHSPVYYTAFVYDTAGNISSGAIASAYAETSGEPLVPINDVGNVPVTEEATSTIVDERVTIDMKMPTLADFSVWQTEKTVTFIDPTIKLNPTESFIISLPKAAVAGNLKSIIATVINPTNQQQAQSFLLRINQTTMAYEAHVPPVLVSGESRIVVTIYDYEAFVVATYKVPLVFAEPVAARRAGVLFPDVFIAYGAPLVSGIAFLALVLFLILLARRRQQDQVSREGMSG